MRFEVLMLLLASGTVASTAALSSPEAEDRIWRYRHSDALMVGDFADLRREALDLMPRGSRLDAAERKLTSIGFSCSGTPHGLPNVNGPSLVCSSNGRGYPVSPQINLTVMSRSGLVSDYEVWNLFESASASTSRQR